MVKQSGKGKFQSQTITNIVIMASVRDYEVFDIVRVHAGKSMKRALQGRRENVMRFKDGA